MGGGRVSQNENFDGDGGRGEDGIAALGNRGMGFYVMHI